MAILINFLTVMFIPSFVALAAVIYLAAASSDTYTPNLGALPFLPDDWLKGSVFYSQKASDLTTRASLSALTQLKRDLRANAVIIQFIWHVDSKTSSQVYADDQVTPATSTLEHFINVAHHSDLKYDL